MRLLRLVFVVYVVIVIGIGVSRVIGHSQPVPANIQRLYFTVCDLPCWIGIVPGQTSFQVAKENIAQVFQEPDYKVETLSRAEYGNSAQLEIGLSRMTESAERATSVWLRAANGIVTHISFTNMQIPLGDILGLLGTPSCAMTGIIGTHFGIINFAYPNDGAIQIGGISQWSGVSYSFVSYKEPRNCEKPFEKVSFPRGKVCVQQSVSAAPTMVNCSNRPRHYSTPAKLKSSDHNELS
jgi:hypothetical protein